MSRVGIILLLAFAGYSYTDAVYLRNPATGQTVKCGPYRTNAGTNPELAGTQEHQCINDYQVQGFVRVPSSN
jgi:hypothetical protein